MTQKTILWSKALKGNYLCGYQKQVSATVAPLIGHLYSCADELNKEIIVVSEKICSAARQSLPLRKNSAKNGNGIKIKLYLALPLQRKQPGTSGLLTGAQRRDHPSMMPRQKQELNLERE